MRSMTCRSSCSVDRARAVHLAHHPASEVELCTLLSVKTGGCSEDCGYCSQSSHHATGVRPQRMLDVDDVLAAARRAKELGSTRFCMGAAWRDAKEGPAFDRVLEMIRGVKAIGIEACVTLGMVSVQQANRLKEAGLDAYNHNLDTSRERYPSIVSTHTYDERLATLSAVRAAGITVCSGGVIGMGESIDDRCEMLRTLASLEPHPESVPINALVPVPGTPLADAPRVDPIEVVRMVACARILMPRARVRLSAGRKEMSREAQILAIYAGANSIFFGDTLLTTPNPDSDDDRALLRVTGLHAASARARRSSHVRVKTRTIRFPRWINIDRDRAGIDPGTFGDGSKACVRDRKQIVGFLPAGPGSQSSKSSRTGVLHPTGMSPRSAATSYTDDQARTYCRESTSSAAQHLVALRLPLHGSNDLGPAIELVRDVEPRVGRATK